MSTITQALVSSVVRCALVLSIWLALLGFAVAVAWVNVHVINPVLASLKRKARPAEGADLSCDGSAQPGNAKRT